MHPSQWCVLVAFVVACASSAPAPTASQSPGGPSLAGHFGGNAFDRNAVTGPTVRMSLRSDGTWGGMFPCRAYLGHPSNQSCAADVAEKDGAIFLNGAFAFRVFDDGRSVFVQRPPLEYQFATVADRPFPHELLLPLFLAVTSARDTESSIVAREHAEGTWSLFDNQAGLLWIVEVEGVGRVGVRRGPTPARQ
jgi:hypothetical protein